MDCVTAIAILLPFVTAMPNIPDANPLVPGITNYLSIFTIPKMF